MTLQLKFTHLRRADV